MADTWFEGAVACEQCDPTSWWKPTQIFGHQNKHRNDAKAAARANDSSDVPAGEASVNQQGETKGPDSEWVPPQGVRPVVVHRPKVADGLIPWLSVMGLAVHQRNEYDGKVFSQGIPGFVGALDDVAQENDSLYRLLEGIKKGDSPNFRLALATLAIILPILANHRPDNGLLRNAVGGMRLMPGTDIPPLPKRPEQSDADYNATEDMTTRMREQFENMSEEEQTVMAEAFAQIPEDLITRLVTAQTSPAMMDHPEVTVTDDATPEG